MQRDLLLPRSVLLLTFAFVLVSPVSGPAGSMASTAVAVPLSVPGVFNEFAVPTSGSSPYGITAGPDGNIWFTESGAGKIGRITPQGQVTEFGGLSPLAGPLFIAAGPDGNIWFTESGAGKIGRITPQGQVTEFALSNPHSQPYGITAGSDSNIWFTEMLAGKIGRISPDGTITEIPLPDPSSLPTGIVDVPQQGVYFTVQDSDQIGRLGPDITLSFDKVVNPPICEQPSQITFALYGTGAVVWITKAGNMCGAEPGVVTVVSNVRQVQGAYSAAGITNGPAKSGLFYTQPDSDRIGWLVPNSENTNWTQVNVEGLQAGSYPYGITAGPDGNIWFTEFKGNRIGRLAVPALAPTPTPLPGTSRTFPETGKTVKGAFLAYWNGHGGLAQQGYPISDEFQELSDTDGKTYLVQYFERAEFELHPENAPPYNVLLSLLGTFRYKQKYPAGAPNQTPNASPGSVLFTQTGHRLGGKFLAYWNSHGGLAQQGYPISDEFQEKSDLNGQTYIVQYFERAVFESHPENASPYDVLLSQLGTFRYKQKYLSPGVIVTR